MSRSKRPAAREDAAPRGRGNWLKDAEGRVRGGWLLAASLLCCGLIRLAARLALIPGLAALFRAWGIDALTAPRAPGWARLAWRWQGSLLTAVTSLTLLLASLWLRKLWRAGSGAETMKAGEAFSGKRLLLGAAAGLGLAVFVLLMGLLPDSLRREPVAPTFRPGLVAMAAVGLLAVLAEEVFTKRVLYDGALSRWGRGWASAIAVIAFFLMNGGVTGLNLSVLNVLLLGLLGCAAYDRYGLWAAVGLRWAWSFATVFLMGFGGGEVSLLRFYAVSEIPLTGGDAGPIYGLWATAAFALALAWLERDRFRLKGKGD